MKKITKKALEYILNDKEFTTYILEKVTDGGDTWDLTFDGSKSLCVPKIKNFIPEKGMWAKLYGKGFGYTVRGVVINEVIFYYRTPEEAEQDHKAWCRKNDREKETTLKKNLKKMDAEYDALPDIFKKRIDAFRANNPNFRRDYEGYEMFCIKEAIKIANAVKDPTKIDEFYHKPFEEQAKMAGIDDGHSGNTFGCACNLALDYLTNPSVVPKVHGALAPVVGCKAYGCPHEHEETTKSH